VGARTSYRGVTTRVTAILKYDAACRAVAEAKTLDEVRDWEDKAAAVREYTRRAKNRTMELDAIEIQERARKRRGELLLALKSLGQLAQTKKQPVIDDGPVVYTLEELGVTKNESSRDQKIASLDGGSFERLIARCRAYAEEHPEKHAFEMLAAEQKEAKRAADAAALSERTLRGGKVEHLHKLIANGHKFSAILADPPWHFVARSEKGEGRSASGHYTTDRTKAEQIKALPVQQLAADDCVLFMWMVDWCPQLALDVIEAWGFAHKTTAFTWAKENASGEGWHMGQGYWTRANPEDCWLATRGHPKRINADVRQLIVAPVMEHSCKPGVVHEYIERLVDGPYLELYARRDRENWVTWGNELEFKTPLPPHDTDTGEIREPARVVASTQAAPSPVPDDGLDIPAFLRIGDPAYAWRTPLE
jgi:N6-adenosine-specific RNA methylase IME4